MIFYRWLIKHLMKCAGKIASLDQPEIYEEFVDE